MLVFSEHAVKIQDHLKELIKLLDYEMIEIFGNTVGVNVYIFYLQVKSLLELFDFFLLVSHPIMPEYLKV